MPSFDDEDDEIGGESSSNNKRSASLLGHRKKQNLMDVSMPFADEDRASKSVPRSNGHSGGGKAHNGWQTKKRNAGLEDTSSSFEDGISAKHPPPKDVLGRRESSKSGLDCSVVARRRTNIRVPTSCVLPRILPVSMLVVTTFRSRGGE
jgi:hypothetical protein